jgi:hypothetical protein
MLRADRNPEVPGMLFKKLFQVLVLGGAVIGASAGCAQANAQGKKPPPADAGTTSSGGGVKGW